MSQRTKFAVGIILALLLALSLTGISYYFPSTQDTRIISVEGNGEKIPTYAIRVPITLPNITIREDGTIEPQDVPVQRVGDSYTVTADIINQTLRIKRDNTVIDGAGHKIQGVISAIEGIVIQNRMNVTLKNIKVTQFWYGISLTNCSNITIDGNRLTSIGSKAIMIDSGNDIIISDNKLDSVGTAIEITATNGFSANNTVARNIIINAAQGITIDGNFSTITENNLVNIYNPIGAMGNNTTISKNEIVHGIDGIFLTGSNCTIYGNNVTNFSESGMTINLGTNSNIYENNVSNSKYALILRNSGDTWIIENNTFYHNNFLNNTHSVRIESPSHQNYWDNGSEGNYWSNYNGTDNDGDGIGDTAYVIDANNTDSYPLITPYESINQTNDILWVFLGLVGLTVFVAIVVTVLVVNRNKSKV